MATMTAEPLRQQHEEDDEEDDDDDVDFMSMCVDSAPSNPIPTPTASPLNPLPSTSSPISLMSSSGPLTMEEHSPSRLGLSGWSSQGQQDLASLPSNAEINPGVFVDPDEFPTLGAAPKPKSKSTSAWNSSSSSTTTNQAPWKTHLSQDDDEDEEIQKVLQLSKEEISHRGSWDNSNQPQRGPALTTTMVAGATGLVNRQGEYNCFLNVIIQCLWHCESFRTMMKNEIGRIAMFASEVRLGVGALIIFFCGQSSC